MKTIVRTAFAIAVLACLEGRAQAQGNGASAPVQNAASETVKQEAAQAKKPTEAEKAEADLQKKVEPIQKLQEAQDSLNTANINHLREEAQRAIQERKSRQTGGGYPQESSAGKSPKK